MARQRQLLNTRLGLDVAAKIGMDMTELFSAEDLRNNTDVNTQSSDDHLKVAYNNKKNMLTRRKESDTYLATVSRHCWSRQIMMR